MLTAGFGIWLLFPSEAMWSPALVHAKGMASEAALGRVVPVQRLCALRLAGGERGALVVANPALLGCVHGGVPLSAVVRKYRGL